MREKAAASASAWLLIKGLSPLAGGQNVTKGPEVGMPGVAVQICCSFLPRVKRLQQVKYSLVYARLELAASEVHLAGDLSGPFKICTEATLSPSYCRLIACKACDTKMTLNGILGLKAAGLSGCQFQRL